MTTKQGTSRLFLGACLVAMAAYYLVHGAARDIVNQAVGVACVAAIVVGVRRHRPRPAASWWLIAAGIGAFVVGDLIWDFYEIVLRIPSPFPSVADAAYLAGYPLLALALWRNGRARKEPKLAQYDAAVFVTAGFVPMLEFLVLPMVSDQNTASTFSTVVSLAYPVCDLLLLAVLVRLLLNGLRTGGALQLFAVGLGGMLVADIAFARMNYDGTYTDGRWFDCLWMLTYACTGAAALRPDMVTLGRAEGDTSEQPRRLRLAFLACAAVIAPVIAVFDSDADSTSRMTLTSAAVVVAVLVIGRLGMTVRALDTRTRALQEAIVARDGLTERLRHASLHDSLTGLPNREAFAAAVRALVESGGNHVVAFCDLDEFKAVNDDHGHGAGDRVLSVVAERFRHAVRPGDVVARLGGDEFGVLWRDVPDTESASAFAQRLLDVLREPIALGDVSVRVGASVGMTLTGGATREYAELLADADVAVYGAKRAGRGHAVFFTPAMREQVLGPTRVAARLADAIDGGFLRVVFQPVVSTRSRQMMAVEALVRWDDHGVAMAPGEFLPIAVDHGLIAALDGYVLSLALESFTHWREAPTRLHVNASPQFLAQPDVVDVVSDALVRHGVPPSRLTLEMTEYAFDGDSRLLVEHCAALRGLGVSFALDDFGTGYSSLSYLQRFRFDALKLDGGLTALVEGDECPPMLRAVVRLGHSLGLRVIAEGVETEQQFEALRAVGCDEVQGFAISVPRAMRELQLPTDLPDVSVSRQR